MDETQINETKPKLVFYYDKDLPQVGSLKRKYLQEKVVELSNIPQPIQKSPEWYSMRETMLTASDWGAILGDNPYDDGTEVLLSKCGKEKIFPKSAMDAMDWGNKYEDVAILIYKHRNNVEVLDFGCIKHPFISFLGASPDGITPDGVMLEIKCPTRRKIDGIPPPYYWCQVQGQLEVCDLDRCDFLECHIKEYHSENDYINDNFDGNRRLNQFGNEKGVTAELYRRSDPNKKRFYEYSPVNIVENELEEWKNNIVSKYESNDIVLCFFSYWYLEEVSCVPIYRSHIWFQESKPILEDFWNVVLKYRKLGLDKLEQDIRIKKATKKIARDEKKDSKKKELEKKKNDKKQRNIRDFISLDSDFNYTNTITTDTNDTNDTTNLKDTEIYDDDDEFLIKTDGTSLFNTDIDSNINTQINPVLNTVLNQSYTEKSPINKTSLFN